MKISKKTFILFIVILLGGSLASIFLGIESRLARNYEAYYTIASCLKLYIKATEGTFPKSENDLVNQGLIKIENDETGRKQYYLYYNQLDRYSFDEHLDDDNNLIFKRLKNFDEFSIRYGYDIKDGDTFESSDEKNKLLIDGPSPMHKSVVSWQLYNTMLRYQKDKPAEDQDAGSSHAQ
ncbi:MAG TPA: hypothetical protein ENK70_08005 [Methylophaga sp.]|nr:hypothetical protein [Methylophaga sp.]